MKLVLFIATTLSLSLAHSKSAKCFSIEELPGGPNLTIDIQDRTQNPNVPQFIVTVENKTKATKDVFSASGVINESKVFLRLKDRIPKGSVNANAIKNNDGKTIYVGTAVIGRAGRPEQITCDVK